jgi:hypothetical protein
MLFELATLSEPQRKALQVGTLIQLPEVPEAEREQVAKVALLKAYPEAQVTEACDPIKSLLERLTWPLATLTLPQRIATQVGTLVQLTLVPEAESEQVARVVLLKTYPEAHTTVA